MPEGSPAATSGDAGRGPVRRARQLADELLRPQAEQVDRSEVPRSHVDAWASAGLLGLGGPKAAGGGGAPPAVLREVTEVLAGACGSTWFVLTQHLSPLGVVAASGNDALRERLLEPLCSGEVLAGIAIAQLRRPGTPLVTASPVDGGWRFDGHVPWLTSWGLADVLLLAGVSPDGQVVLAVIDAREQPGLTASPLLPLAAMQATRTVTLDLDGLAVPASGVAATQELSEWVAVDVLRTANAGPHVFGLQQECVRRLSEVAARRGDATAAALGQQLGQEGARLRRVAYSLIDEVPDADAVDDRLAVRASALELAVRSATALVAATGGSAMSLDAAPQRLLREAAFYVVQAQTAPVREATLQLLRDTGA